MSSSPLWSTLYIISNVGIVLFLMEILVDSVADTDDEGDGVGDIGVIDDDGGGGFTSGSS
ncbi:hypothetical protein GYH30_042936 [Glycine max]|nr:hypothetical protein GYH30_042936 [Glycine max]